nr:polymorphic toxin-type HINT domain-containing protein [Streptomyces sp. NBC_01177]
MYSYDAAGRLVGITDPGGQTAHYRYDAAGNRLGIDRYPSSDLSVLSLAPVRAKAGQTVTLSGTGFSTTPVSNTVSFGSKPAEVTSATATRLEVKVPGGAENGKVSVATAGETVQSPEAFDFASPAPAITKLEPASGITNTQVVISGSGFAASTTDNVVRFSGGTLAQVVGRTDTALTVKVPLGAKTGPVEVSTADGTTTSAAAFRVLLGGASEFETTVTTSVTDDAPPTIAVTTPGNKAKVLFDADQGDDVSFGLTQSTFNNGLTLSLYDPTGETVGGNGYLPLSGGGWDLRSLPLSGRYSLVINPGSNNIGAAKVTLSNPTGGVLDFNAAPVPNVIDRPGQNGRWTFNAALGQSLSLGLDTSAMPKTVVARLYGPNGSYVADSQRYVYGNSSDSIDFSALTQHGEYVLVLDPADGATGTVKVTASTYAQAALDLSGPATELVIDRPGQNGRVQFEAEEGWRIQLGLRSTGFPNGGPINIYAPDGTKLDGFALASNADKDWDSSPLPATGTYTITVAPYLTGTGTVTMTLSRSLSVAQLAPTAGPASVSLQRFAQNAESVFHAEAGDNLSLGVSQNTFTSTVYISVFAPSGAKVIDAQSVSAKTSAGLGLSGLPESGTYLVVVDPYQGTTGSLVLTLSSDVQVPLALDGAAVSVTVGRAGQRARGTFSGTAGDHVSLGLTKNTFTSVMYASVIAPSGDVLIDEKYIFAGDNATIGLSDLPESGTYLVVIKPHMASTGTFSLTLSKDVSLTVQADAASAAAHVQRAGQRIQASFTAPDTTTLGFAITDNTVTKSTDISLVGPSGTTADLGSVSSETAGTEYMTGLTPGATYTLTLEPREAATGNLTLWLSKPVQAEALTATSPTKATTTRRPAQALEFTYPAAAGAGAALRFTGNLPGSSSVAVIAPDGKTDSSAGYLSSSSGDIDLRGAPAAGTHHVLVRPDRPVITTATISATLLPDAFAGVLAAGGPKRPIRITTAAQNGSYTFPGTKNQLLTVTVDAPAFAWELSIRGPNGARLVDERYLSERTLTTNLPKLPVAGLYTLTVAPSSQATGTISLGIKATGTTAVAPVTAEPATTPPHPAVVPEGPDAWQPGKAQLAGRDWLTARGETPKAPPQLRAPPGKTALTGHVLKLDGTPLPKVTVNVGTETTRTDAKGRFLLAGIAPDSATMVVDGASANTAKRQYGRFDIHISPKPGQSVDLGFPVWMTPLDTKHTVKFAAPAKSEVVLKTPKIPGLEVRIPKGSVVRDEHGKPVTELGITAIPIDRPPFPLPRNSVVPVYFTVQPGGTYVFPKGAQVIYPNYTHEAPGTQVEFMDYDPEKKGWRVYGHGKVSADGRQVVPDAKTRIWAFHGAMFNIADLIPWDLPWLKDIVDWLSGDPVELGTGMLTDSRTDLAVSDPQGSAEIARTYWQGDTRKRAFGMGRDLSYNAFLHSEKQYKEVDLYLPGGAKVHFTRTSPGTGYSDAVFEPLDTPSEFRGSKIVSNDGQWELRFRDGTVWIFPQYAPLKEIRDRHGNTVQLTRLDGNKGDLTQISTSGGHWISLTYDTEHRVKTATDNTGRFTSYTYDTAGRLETVTDPAGKTNVYTYDGASNRIKTAVDARGIAYMSNTFDTAGRVKEQTLTEGQKYSFEYTQTAAGRITSSTVTQPGGAVRRVEFDTDGYGVKDTQAHGTDLSRTITYERGAYHRIDAIVDPYDRRTELTYDANGYVTETTELAGTTQARMSGKTTFDGPYDQPTSVADPLGNTTVFGYDADGNLETVTDPENRKTTLSYALDGQVRTVTDNAGAATEYTYRSGGLVSVKDAEGRVSTQFTDAAGRASAVTDVAGNLTTIAYDKLNQPRKVTDPLGQSTGFDYDDNGNLTTLTDARDNTSSWTYDDADRPESATDAMGIQATFEYDGAGLVKKVTSRSGQIAKATYDLLGRAKTAQYGVDIAGQAESTVGYGYDGRDLLKQITDTQAGDQSFTYDTYDRPKTVTSPNGTVSYDYDAADRRKTMTAGGQTTSYGFDKSSILTSLTSGTQEIGFELDEVGREKTATMPGGITRTTNYDKTDAIKAIAYTKGAAPIGDLHYTRDVRTLQTGLTGSLANVALPAAEAGTVFGKDNRITTYNGRSFTYDADGQLKTDGLRDYTWNARGELSGLSASGQNSSFGYDALGIRSTKVVGGTTNKFLTDASNPLVEQNSSGDTTATVATSGLDQFLTRTENGGTQVYLTDALGSVLGLANSDGTIATRYAYDPNGQTTTAGTASSNPYTFTGREDDGVGLLHYRDRYYDPETGRFISQDPIGYAGGVNLYQYALSSPTAYTDPTGNNPMVAACAVGGLIDGGLDWAFQRLSGRKVNWGHVGSAALTGCLSGVAGHALGAFKTVNDVTRLCRKPNSFTADTLVLMADGTHKPIKEIKVGDKVLATDPETGETGPRTVTALIEGSGEKELVDLSIETKNTNNKKSGTISATDGHPFWVPDLRRWVDAGDLKPSQLLQTSTGTWVQITAVHAHHETTTVYNLTVDDLHTYFVVAGGSTALVHNSAGGQCGPSDLPDFLDPGSGGISRPRPGGAAADEVGKTQRAAEEAIEEAEDRKKAVSSAPGTVQKVVDGPQVPGGHGVAEAIVAVSIVGVRGWQRVKIWWRR